MVSCAFLVWPWNTRVAPTWQSRQQLHSLRLFTELGDQLTVGLLDLLSIVWESPQTPTKKKKYKKTYLQSQRKDAQPSSTTYQLGEILKLKLSETHVSH